jgi:hypothetical protein
MSAPFNYNTTGLGELYSHDIVISPNPARDVLFVEVPSSSFGAAFSIHDTGGRLIQQGKLTEERKQSLDISAIPPGMYFMKISGSGHPSLHKLLVH